MITIFSAKTLCEISIEDYIERIVKYCKLNSGQVEYAGYLLKKYLRIFLPDLDIYSMDYKLMEHRLVLTSLIISKKNIGQTSTYDNSYWAKVGGLDAKELLDLELEFLFALDWQLDSNVAHDMIDESYPLEGK